MCLIIYLFYSLYLQDPSESANNKLPEVLMNRSLENKGNWFFNFYDHLLIITRIQGWLVVGQRYVGAFVTLN